MNVARVEAIAIKLRLVAWLVAGSLLLPGTSRAQIDFPALPSITVAASNGGFRTYNIRIGGKIFMETTLSVTEFIPFLHVDVYVGAILPDGRFASWVGDPQAPTLVTGAAPVPLVANVVPAATTYYFRPAYTFTAADAQGWYWLYGIVTRAGTDPLLPVWIDVSFWPFLVSPPVTQ